MTTDITKIKANIKKLERAWKADLKKEYGGGLTDKQNEKLIKLRIGLEMLKNAK